MLGIRKTDKRKKHLVPPVLTPSPPVWLFQAGKFDMVPTLINLVAAFTSIGLVGLSHADEIVFLSILSAFLHLFFTVFRAQFCVT